MQLLTRKQIINDSQKSEESFARFSVEIENKKWEMEQKYREMKKTMEEEIESLRNTHKELIDSTKKELQSLENNIKLLKAEREELMKPVDELIYDWKQKVSQQQQLNETLQEKILEQEIAISELITKQDNYYYQTKQSETKEVLFDKKLNDLNEREKIIIEKELRLSELTKELQNITDKLVSRENNITEREKTFEEYRAKTVSQLKERSNAVRQLEIYHKTRHV